MIRMFTVVTVRLLLTLIVGICAVLTFAMWFYARASGEITTGLLWTITLIPPFVALITLPMALFLVRPGRYVADMQSMLAGASWVHWHYDEAQWRVANRIDARRNRRIMLPIVAIAAALGVVFTAIGLATGGTDSTLSFLGLIALGASVTFGLAQLVTSPGIVAGRSKRGDIYISRLGVYRMPGGYTPLVGFGFRVERVELVAGSPPYLSFEVATQRRYNTTTTDRHASVAVPPGCEEEAQRVVERFRAGVG
jgi:hypothetical protein